MNVPVIFFLGLAIIGLITLIVSYLYLRNEPVMPFDNKKLSELSLNFHRSIVKQLIEIYGKENWKQHVIVNARDKEGIDLRKKHLKRFEKGYLQDESIMALLLAEIVANKGDVNIKIKADRVVKVA